MRAALGEVLGVGALKHASSASRARSRQVASRGRTPVIRRPTPQPRRMDDLSGQAPASEPRCFDMAFL